MADYAGELTSCGLAGYPARTPAGAALWAPLGRRERGEARGGRSVEEVQNSPAQRGVDAVDVAQSVRQGSNDLVLCPAGSEALCQHRAQLDGARPWYGPLAGAGGFQHGE